MPLRVLATLAALLAFAPGCRLLDTRMHASDPDVVVVGGGVAGLVAAYELEKRGLSTHVLEMRDVLGGRLVSMDYGQGRAREAGLQELWEGNPLLAIAREVGVPLERGIEAYSSVWIDGELVPFVQDDGRAYLASFLSPSELRALDSWMAEAGRLRARALEKGIADPEVRRLQDLSFRDWIAAAGLPDRVAAWIRLTLSSELGAGWHAYSALFGLLEFRVFLDGGVPNYHVRGGNARLVAELAGAIRGPVTRSARVSRIERRGRGESLRVAVTYVKQGRARVLAARRVVSTVPFTHLHRIVFEPPLSRDRWAAIDSLGLGRYTVVHLLVDRRAEPLWTLDGVSMLPVLTEGPLGVVYGPPEEIPAGADELVFSLLVYGVHARAFHMVPQSQKVEAAVAALDRMFPGFGSHVRSAHVYPYHPAAISTWPPGRSPLDAGSALLRQPDRGLYLAGDWTWNAHADGAARSAIEAAESIARELGVGAAPSR